MPARRMLGQTPMRRLRALLDRLRRRRAPSLHPRLIRRVTIHCPHGGQLVEADLLMGSTGTPRRVLRCSGHPDCPPSCDQSCLRSAESVLAPVQTLIICPPGTGPPEEVD
jgi:hypothetical protein